MPLCNGSVSACVPAPFRSPPPPATTSPPPPNRGGGERGKGHRTHTHITSPPHPKSPARPRGARPSLPIAVPVLWQPLGESHAATLAPSTARGQRGFVFPRWSLCPSPRATRSRRPRLASAAPPAPRGRRAGGLRPPLRRPRRPRPRPRPWRGRGIGGTTPSSSPNSSQPTTRARVAPCTSPSRAPACARGRRPCVCACSDPFGPRPPPPPPRPPPAAPGGGGGGGGGGRRDKGFLRPRSGVRRSGRWTPLRPDPRARGRGRDGYFLRGGKGRRVGPVQQQKITTFLFPHSTAARRRQ
jgi:hypothetical protein